MTVGSTRFLRSGCRSTFVNLLRRIRWVKVIITDEWVREACYTMDALAFDFDVAIGKKYGLKTFQPGMSFVFR